tara:strand:+ start:330 stop:2564 length:2235 start_codon:yes stop_codon:yes gene_type:complete
MNKILTLFVFFIFNYVGFSQLIITEIADPNGSGNHNARYIELYNSSGSAIDLSGYKIILYANANYPDVADSHTLSGTLNPGEFFILAKQQAKFLSTYGFEADMYDAGTPDSNGDDQYVLAETDGTVVDVFGILGTDGTNTTSEFEDGRVERISSVTTPQSTYNVNNFTVDGDNGNGDGAQNAPGGYDPGYWIGATSIDTWNGLTDATWHTGSNWASGTAPASGDKIFIRDSSTNPIISTTDIVATNLSVESSGSLTINAGKDLTLTGNFSNSGQVTLNSDSQNFSSLIIQGTSSGNIIYNRWINSISTGSPTSGDPGWDLVGSPVVGASLTSSNFSQNGSNYAIQPYDNSDNTWTATSSASVSTSLGAGYAMAKATAGTEAFTGTVENLDKDVNITNNSSGSGTQWNLVANPYPSYLALNSAAAAASSATTNFITQNAVTADVLGSGTNEDALWYWKGFEYGQYNNSSSAVYIAPGQGFFIASKTGGGTLKFLESMQTTTGSDDFISGDILEDNRGELFINLNQNNFIRETEIYFIEGTTDGSDPTYDARTFPMNDNTISIFTRLVEADEGVDLSIQALAYSEMWDKVIPIGVNALGGEEMTISISHRTTPADLNIYLEDIEEGTITNLLDGDYILTPTSDQVGVGRFFIHMSADTMSNEEVSTSMLNAYKEIDANYITIEGLGTQSNETRVILYNILGKEVFSTTLNNNMGTQTISTIEISAGIYVIKLESESDRLIKKLLIQ